MSKKKKSFKSFGNWFCEHGSWAALFVFCIKIAANVSQAYV